MFRAKPRDDEITEDFDAEPTAPTTSVVVFGNPRGSDPRQVELSRSERSFSANGRHPVRCGSFHLALRAINSNLGRFGVCVSANKKGPPKGPFSAAPNRASLSLTRQSDAVALHALLPGQPGVLATPETSFPTNVPEKLIAKPL